MKFVVKTVKLSKSAKTSVATLVVHVWEDGRVHRLDFFSQASAPLAAATTKRPAYFF